ncbi:hypothetical protein, partial [Chryseobacterium pennae]|uniref:hypothetical protein n=1 Tax=Chryseobacterium pennae TaxID=2258962 RepID=UPI001E2B01C0
PYSCAPVLLGLQRYKLYFNPQLFKVKSESFFSSLSFGVYNVSAYLKALLRLLNLSRFSVGQR